MHSSLRNSGSFKHGETVRRPKECELPFELVLIIIRIIFADIASSQSPKPPHNDGYPHVFMSGPTDPFATSNNLQLERYPNTEKQRLLCSLALVGRSWNSVATELLYAEPFLTTPRQIHLLCRTLRGSSSLRRAILSITVVDARNVDHICQPYSTTKYTNPDTQPPSNHIGKRLTRYLKSRDIKQQVQAIEALLNMGNVNSLSSVFLSITRQSQYDEQSRASLFVPALPLASQLRHVTIHDGTSSTVSNLCLPNLETLCLRCFVFDQQKSIPIFPRLHTLQIVYSFFWVQFISFFSSGRIPSLRTLEFYHCKHHSGRSPLRDTSQYPQLERLHFVGQAELTNAFELMKGSELSGIRQLVLGLRDLGPLAPYFYAWRMPPTLECLTILVLEHLCSVLTDVLRLVQANQKRRKLRSLRRLVIIGYDDGRARRDEAAILIDQICSICVMEKVEFVLEENGTSNGKFIHCAESQIYCRCERLDYQETE